MLPPDIKTLLDDVEKVFGDREGSTYHQISFKQPLEDRLTLNSAKMKGVKFVNRLGCRGGVYASNALALIQYHSHIVPVIEGAIIATKKKIERKSTATARKQLDKLANMYNMLTIHWNRTHLFLGTILMIQSHLVKVIFRAENHNLSVTEKKLLVTDLVDRYHKILHQSGEPFEKLRCLGLRPDCSLSGAETLAIRETEKLYQTTSAANQTEVDEFITQGSASALQKVNKDCSELMKLPDSDDLVPSTNRNLEGAFASYKRLEKIYEAMDPMMQETVTRAMVNKLIEWFDTKTPQEQQDLLNNARKERSSDQAQVKATKTALKRKRSSLE